MQYSPIYARIFAVGAFSRTHMAMASPSQVVMRYHTRSSSKLLFYNIYQIQISNIIYQTIKQTIGKSATPPHTRTHTLVWQKTRSWDIFRPEILSIKLFPLTFVIVSQNLCLKIFFASSFPSFLLLLLLGLTTTKYPFRANY